MDHRKYVVLLNILLFVRRQHLARHVGRFTILELKVLNVRPAKRIQEKIIIDFKNL